ncbi:hypothetical protein P8C59_009205 [Phyllachora maydis]|uniref:Uncharacterized protein n=1 Tax=Phyllachora maydis TaxID=1825666 RepID=A0AAD9MG02_9PEZI|nr:hypothetical protein P8C59_009205 [Phyllachora maydis]
MNTRPLIDTAEPATVLSVAFNSCSNWFSAGMNHGFRVFHAPACTPVTRRDLHGGVGLAQMMDSANSTQFLALVGGGSRPLAPPNKVIIWNEDKKKDVLQITTLSPVRGVKLGRDRVVVVLQHSVRVYRFKKPPDLIAAYDTTDNRLGLCALSERTIAFPGRTAGQVQLVDIATGNVSIIPAHSSALRALCISPDGELLGTASEKGTLLRVFATANCARLAEVRRGIDPATIFSLAFSPSGAMLACTSDKFTLHIFDVPHPTKPPRKQPANPPPAPSQPAGTSGLPSSSSSSFPANNVSAGGAGEAGDGSKGKWGFLGRIPLMPRLFSDTYSVASAPFEGGPPAGGGDGDTGGSAPGAEAAPAPAPAPAPAAASASRPQPPSPQRGQIGWTSDTSLVVVGAGADARWEKFNISVGDEGRLECVREGWKRYGNVD